MRRPTQQTPGVEYDGNWTTRGLDKSQTGQLAVSQMLPNRKTKHAKSPMASATCPVYASCLVRELSSNQYDDDVALRSKPISGTAES